MSSKRITYLIEAINRTAQPMKEVQDDLERLRSTRIEASKIALEERRAQSLLIQIYRQQYAQYYNVFGIMRQVGYIGNSLMSMWTAYNIGMMRVEESINNVAEAQRWMNAMLDIYGENSVQYQDAVDRYEEALKAAKNAQDSFNTGLITMGLTAIGTMAQVGNLILKIQELGGLGAILGGLGAAISGLGTAAATALSPFITALGTILSTILNISAALVQVSVALGVFYEAYYALTTSADKLAQDLVDLNTTSMFSMGPGGVTPFDIEKDLPEDSTLRGIIESGSTTLNKDIISVANANRLFPTTQSEYEEKKGSGGQISTGMSVNITQNIGNVSTEADEDRIVDKTITAIEDSYNERRYG